MLEYDYLLTRKEGDEYREFRPKKIPTKLPDLVYIEGPNSSGKSTLLHIIALGLYGLENDKLNPALRKKMNSLIESDYQQIKFDFKIQNKNIIIQSKKEDVDKTNIEVLEIIDGQEKILRPDAFHQKYNLIYDIPENPTERLNQLTLLIKSSQSIYGHKIAVLRKHIRTVILEIGNSRDPLKIDELSNKLIKITEEIKKLKDELKLIEVELDSIEDLLYCSYYLFYVRKYFEYETKRNKVNHSKKKIENKSKKINKEKDELYNELKNKIQYMNNIYNDLSYLLGIIIPKKDENLVHLWQKIDLNESLSYLQFDNNLKNLMLSIKLVLTNIIERDVNKIEFEEAKIYRDLINLLENYKSSQLILPEFGKTIPEILSVLKKSSQKYDKSIKLTKNVEDALTLIKQLEDLRNEIENKYFQKLKKYNNYQTEETKELYDNYLSETELLNIEKKLFEIQGKIDYYQSLCGKKEIPDKNVDIRLKELTNIPELSPYFNFTEDQLNEKILQLNERKVELGNIIKNKEHYQKEYQIDLNSLKNKELHPYQPYLSQLNRLHTTCLELEQKMLNEYSSYIDPIIKRKIFSSSSLSNAQIKYYDEVSKYLGKKVNFIRHIDTDYKISKIDLIKGIILTEDNKTINLIDMGTGQSQSAYLMGLLNSDDNRKIIALFDEVAMMDTNSLKPIFSKLKELHSKNKLLFGAVIQKADDIKIVPIQ